MRRHSNRFDFHTLSVFFSTIFAVVLYEAGGAASVAEPSTSCYVLDNSSHIYDFSKWVGYPFEYEGKDTDFVVRFCKDVESRAQPGYVDFGRFDNFNYFVAGSGRFNFVQEFYNGDLMRCEGSYDKMGRTAQVNIICGDCPKDSVEVDSDAFAMLLMYQLADILLFMDLISRAGITSEMYSTMKKTLEIITVLLELAIPCEKQGSRVFEGFTVGFHPQSWEIVYNGMTQLGFEKAYDKFSFKTEQTHAALYMTAIASVSGLVHQPIVKVLPEHGLAVKLSGSGSTGFPPTTLSPAMFNVEWRCEKARDTPYEVQVTIPVDGYEPIQFTLTKMCEYRQDEVENAARGWALFGVLSCIFIIGSTLVCCVGFVYKSRVQNQRGLDALPGMNILSVCLDTLSGGGGQSYARPDDLNSPFGNQASWSRQPTAPQGASRTTEIRYGSI